MTEYIEVDGQIEAREVEVYAPVLAWGRMCVPDEVSTCEVDGIRITLGHTFYTSIGRNG